VGSLRENVAGNCRLAACSPKSKMRSLLGRHSVKVAKIDF
jgi:hypothetical protein